MILVFLLYLSFPLIIAVLFYVFGIRSKRVFIGLPAGFLALSFLLISGCYLF